MCIFMILISFLLTSYLSFHQEIFHFEETFVQKELVHSAAVYRRRRFRVGTIRRYPRIELASKKTEESWTGYFSARNFKTTTEKRQLLEYKSNIEQALEKLPDNHIANLKSLEVRNESHVSRGMANSQKIIINTGTIETDNELLAILIHEMAHVVDLGVLKGGKGIRTSFYDGRVPVLADDPSYKFYNISWQNAKTRKGESMIKDFVTGYAMSNAFEDFAEHYLFYRLHGEKFRSLAENSEALRQKYDFFKIYIFRGDEFQRDKESKSLTAGSIWDATLIDYELKDIVGEG